MDRYNLSVGMPTAFRIAALNKNGKELSVALDQPSILTPDAGADFVTLAPSDASTFIATGVKEGTEGVTVQAVIGGVPWSTRVSFPVVDGDTTVASIAVLPVDAVDSPAS